MNKQSLGFARACRCLWPERLNQICRLIRVRRHCTACPCPCESEVQIALCHKVCVSAISCTENSPAHRHIQSVSCPVGLARNSVFASNGWFDDAFHCSSGLCLRQHSAGIIFWQCGRSKLQTEPAAGMTRRALRALVVLLPSDGSKTGPLERCFLAAVCNKIRYAKAFVSQF